jgi:hypothetical protein
MWKGWEISSRERREEDKRTKGMQEMKKEGKGLK